MGSQAKGKVAPDLVRGPAVQGGRKCHLNEGSGSLGGAAWPHQVLAPGVILLLLSDHYFYRPPLCSLVVCQPGTLSAQHCVGLMEGLGL